MEALINAFHYERIGYRELLRGLIAHKSWIIPATKQDDQYHPSLFQHNGQTFLTVYSHPSLAPKNMDTITVDGIWLFSELPTNIHSLVIDAQSEHALQFTAEKFAELRTWSLAIQFEQRIDMPQLEAPILEHILQYEGYCVPLVDSEGGTQHIALAPDQEGRKLAAVFTAEDCLDIFIQHAGSSLGEKVRIDQHKGETLLPYLFSLPIDGIVLNCYGPPPPKALEKDALLQLLSIRKNNAEFQSQ